MCIRDRNEGPIMCAEGYLFAMERRGYLQAGAYVPEVVLEHPDVVTQLHREFIRSGSDVVQAFTYYGHREKLRLIGKEDLLEPLQRNALKIAKDAADDTDAIETDMILKSASLDKFILRLQNFYYFTLYITRFPDDNLQHNNYFSLHHFQIIFLS